MDMSVCFRSRLNYTYCFFLMTCLIIQDRRYNDICHHLIGVTPMICQGVKIFSAFRRKPIGYRSEYTISNNQRRSGKY